MLTIMLRSMLIYFIIIFGMRLMGKKQIGELQPIELVIAFLISDVATVAVENTELPILIGITPVIVLIALELIISIITLKSGKFSAIVSGHPVLIINKGIIDTKALKKLRFSIDDLMVELRSNNIFDINDVQYAIIETNGKLSVLKKHSTENVTRQDLDISGEDPLLQAVIISDGRLIKKQLELYNIREEWIYKILHDQNETLDSVFLMTSDEKLNYRIIPYSEVINKNDEIKGELT